MTLFTPTKPFPSTDKSDMNSMGPPPVGCAAAVQTHDNGDINAMLANATQNPAAQELTPEAQAMLLRYMMYQSRQSAGSADAITVPATLAAAWGNSQQQGNGSSISLPAPSCVNNNNMMPPLEAIARPPSIHDVPTSATPNPNRNGTMNNVAIEDYEPCDFRPPTLAQVSTTTPSRANQTGGMSWQARQAQPASAVAAASSGNNQVNTNGTHENENDELDQDGLDILLDSSFVWNDVVTPNTDDDVKNSAGDVTEQANAQQLNEQQQGGMQRQWNIGQPTTRANVYMNGVQVSNLWELDTPNAAAAGQQQRQASPPQAQLHVQQVQSRQALQGEREVQHDQARQQVQAQQVQAQQVQQQQAQVQQANTSAATAASQYQEQQQMQEHLAAATMARVSQRQIQQLLRQRQQQQLLQNQANQGQSVNQIGGQIQNQCQLQCQQQIQQQLILNQQQIQQQQPSQQQVQRPSSAVRSMQSDLQALQGRQSVLSMQTDLQALLSMHQLASIQQGTTAASPAAASPAAAAAASCPQGSILKSNFKSRLQHLQRQQHQQGISFESSTAGNSNNNSNNRGRKRTARSMPRDSHNPRGDNSSNWDSTAMAVEEDTTTVASNKTKKQKYGIVVEGGYNGNGSTSSSGGQTSSFEFQYVQVVGGGMIRPAATSLSSVSDSSSGTGNGSSPCMASATTSNGSRFARGNGGSMTSNSSSGTLPAQPQVGASNTTVCQGSTSSSASNNSTDVHVKPSLNPHHPSTLQDYLDSLLSSRGYHPQKLSSSELGYYTKPSPLQLASFGFAVCSSIKPTGAGRLRALLNCGLSPNPTNKFGESPFFMACKRGLYQLVEVFIEAGAKVHVSDGFGRTPLHYVAWSNPPCFESARLILRRDARLLYVTDARGKTPLDYVGEQFNSRWVDFLEGGKEELWPVRNDHCTSGAGGMNYCPEEARVDTTNEKEDGTRLLCIELAEKVASGHVMPQEAQKMQEAGKRSTVNM